MNTTAISGNLTHDPELKTTSSGKSILHFSVAVQRPYSSKETDFIEVVAWEKQAEFICQYFKKGNRIEVNGYLQTRTYEDKKGDKRKAVELIAQNVGFAGMNQSEANANAAPSNYYGGYPAQPQGYYPPQPMQPAASAYYPPQAAQPPAYYTPQNTQPQPAPIPPAPVPAKRTAAGQVQPGQVPAGQAPSGQAQPMQPASQAPMPTVADFTAGIQYPNGINAIWEEVS